MQSNKKCFMGLKITLNNNGYNIVLWVMLLIAHVSFIRNELVILYGSIKVCSNIFISLKEKQNTISIINYCISFSN